MSLGYSGGAVPDLHRRSLFVGRPKHGRPTTNATVNQQCTRMARERKPGRALRRGRVGKRKWGNGLALDKRHRSHGHGDARFRGAMCDRTGTPGSRRVSGGAPRPVGFSRPSGRSASADQAFATSFSWWEGGLSPPRRAGFSRASRPVFRRRESVEASLSRSPAEAGLIHRVGPVPTS